MFFKTLHFWRIKKNYLSPWSNVLLVQLTGARQIRDILQFVAL